jgi:hypothetical protein
MPAPSLRNNHAKVVVVGIDAAGLTRHRVGGHETPLIGAIDLAQWSAEAQGDEYQQALMAARSASPDRTPTSTPIEPIP